MGWLSLARSGRTNGTSVYSAFGTLARLRTLPFFPYRLVNQAPRQTIPSWSTNKCAFLQHSVRLYTLFHCQIQPSKAFPYQAKVIFQQWHLERGRGGLFEAFQRALRPLPAAGSLGDHPPQAQHDFFDGGGSAERLVDPALVLLDVGRG